MKLVARGNFYKDIYGTVYSVNEGDEIDVNGDAYENVGTVLEVLRQPLGRLQNTPQPLSSHDDTSTLSGWSDKYANGYDNIKWHHGGSTMPIKFDDVDMENIGTFYRGPGNIEVSVIRGSMKNVGTVIDEQGYNTFIVKYPGGSSEIRTTDTISEQEMTGMIEMASSAHQSGRSFEDTLSSAGITERLIQAGANISTILAFFSKAIFGA